MGSPPPPSSPWKATESSAVAHLSGYDPYVRAAATAVPKPAASTIVRLLYSVATVCPFVCIRVIHFPRNISSCAAWIATRTAASQPFPFSPKPAVFRPFSILPYRLFISVSFVARIVAKLGRSLWIPWLKWDTWHGGGHGVSRWKLVIRYSILCIYIFFSYVFSPPCFPPVLRLFLSLFASLFDAYLERATRNRKTSPFLPVTCLWKSL